LYDAVKPKSQISDPTMSTLLTCCRIGVRVLQRERGPLHGLAPLRVAVESPGRPLLRLEVCAPSTLISRSIVLWMTEMASSRR